MYYTYILYIYIIHIYYTYILYIYIIHIYYTYKSITTVLFHQATGEKDTERTLPGPLLHCDARRGRLGSLWWIDQRQKLGICNMYVCMYTYIADYATMVTDSRAQPERDGPPDPKTPENGSALLSSAMSFLWRPHQRSLVHRAYKSPQLTGLPEPHVLSDMITQWSFVPPDNSLSTRMFQAHPQGWQV